ncbi:twin transmembrane helix small protein [Roseovarius phycicola]|uniref:Twin transmembrane helix small protein n=1 Tax=Roseovarius phycicola TaxID=3080976 RepID=A0ABZ2HE96_9RHOB
MLKDPLFILAALACGVVAVILIKGISTFGKEGVENAKRANKFMQYRIIAQFVAVLLILLFVYVRRQAGGE